MVLNLLRRIWRPQAVLRPETAALYPVPPEADARAVREGIAALQRYAAPEEASPLDDERPIFILAVGWRVGSTLLQRLCCSDKSALIWGEALGPMGMVARLSEAICIARPQAWPSSKVWMDRRAPEIGEEDLSSRHIGNLYPPSDHFREALQQFLFRWLGEPARKMGYRRWGLKETRLSGADAVFLQWLFPRAVFLPLIRHPFDAYRSRKAMGSAVWVDPRARSAETFARHWNRLALSWTEPMARSIGSVIRYEDLIADGYPFHELDAATGLSLEPDGVLARKVGGSTREDSTLDRKERTLIYRIAREGMKAHSYRRRL